MEEVQTRVPQLDQDTIRFEIFTGLRNDRPAERFEHSDLAAGTNADIDNSGAVSRRAGYTQVLAGGFHSVWSDNDQCLLVNAGALKKSDPSYNLTTLRTLVDARTVMSYAKAVDRVFFSNETDTGIVENGTARTWGIAVPPAPSVAVTVGSMSAGTYQYTLTYIRSDGQESGAALASVIVVPDGGGLNFTLPVSADPDVVLKNIYLSTPDGEVLYWATSVANDQTTASYTGDALELTLPLLTQFLGPAPAGQIVGYYRGRMYVAAGDKLYPSEPFAYELFDLRKYIWMDGRITLFAAMEDKERAGAEGMNSGLFLGTDRSCGVLVGKDEFQYVPKTEYGAIEGAVTYVDGSVFGDKSTGADLLPVWMTTQGICVGLPQMEIKNLTRARFHFTADGKGAAHFNPDTNRLILSSNY